MSVIHDDNTVGVYELKTHLSAVLDEVVAGRSVTVTRHGHPIVTLTPAKSSTAAERKASFAAMRELAHGRTLGVPLRDAIDEGRK